MVGQETHPRMLNLLYRHCPFCSTIDPHVGKADMVQLRHVVVVVAEILESVAVSKAVVMEQKQIVFAKSEQ